MTSIAEPRTRPVDLGSLVAIVGLATGSLFMVVRIVTDELRPPSSWMEDASFAAIVVAPFLISVLAHRWEASVRAGVWIGVGLLTTFLGLMTLISIGVVFLTIGVLLVVGGVLALRPEPVSFRRFLVSATLVVAAGVMAPVGSLFLLPPTPECWERHGDAQAWQRVRVRGAAADRAYGGGGVVGVCSSDTVTPVEAGIAGSSWLAAGAALTLWARRRELA